MTDREVSQPSAVALVYREQQGAPTVAAKGRGAIAEEIICRARAAGVFVHESRELVQLLMQVDLDAHIPPALYRVIAELLAWIYRLEQGRGTEQRLLETTRPSRNRHER
jgi:flagellar biosynthesis protein